MKEKIKKYFEEHHLEIEKEIIELTARMVREKTVNVVPEKLSEHPYLSMRGEEFRVGKIVKEMFDAWGITYDVYERQKGRMNVVGKLGKDSTGKRLLVACHMDIVPAGEGWDTDPFDPAVVEGFIYGRGVLDNKGPLAASMLAAKVLHEVVGSENISGQLQIAALADEEAADPEADYGIGYLLEEDLIHPTYAIIPDIGENMKKIDIAEKGRLVLKISAKGVQAHGSTPERGVNAVYKMARFVTLLEDLTLKYNEHSLLGAPTVNLGEIHGGAAPNIVPGDCYIYLDIRSIPGQTTQAILSEIDTLARSVADDFSVEVQSESTPHAIEPDNIIVKAIQDNVQELMGFKPEPFGMGGGTFAKTLNLSGIAAVGFGPGDDEAFHVANERVEIKQLVDFARLISAISLDLL